MITESYAKTRVRHHTPPLHEDVFVAVAGVLETEWFLDIENPATGKMLQFFGSDPEELAAIFHQFEQLRVRLGLDKE